MARITIEDCLNQVNNRFALIHMAAKRVRQLRKGAEPAIQSKNKDIVVSLREIAAGKVTKAKEGQERPLLEPEPTQLEALPEESTTEEAATSDLIEEAANEVEGDSAVED